MTTWASVSLIKTAVFVTKHNKSTKTTVGLCLVSSPLCFSRTDITGYYEQILTWQIRSQKLFSKTGQHLTSMACSWWTLQDNAKFCDHSQLITFAVFCVWYVLVTGFIPLSL